MEEDFFDTHHHHHHHEDGCCSCDDCVDDECDCEEDEERRDIIKFMLGDDDTSTTPRNIMDILLDPDNTEEINLTDADGNLMSFMQIAVIPHNETLYCILKPITEIPGVADDEAIVFRVTEENGMSALVIENDESTAMVVFDEYLSMVDAEDPLEEDNIY